MLPIARALLLVALAPAPGLAAQFGGSPVATVDPASPPPPDSIGTATMGADGEILLQLRAEAPGIIGDALLRYRPGDPGYDAVRKHLAGLRPGVTLFVPRFDNGENR